MDTDRIRQRLEGLTFYTADHREAVQAFLDKRDPVFGQNPGI